MIDETYIRKIRPDLMKWVEEVSALTKPSEIVWCDGSQGEKTRIEKEMLEKNELIALGGGVYENCYLYRNDPSDVARVEDRTFICSKTQEEAGPTNNWMASDAAKKTLDGLFDGVMKDRKMYVIPYILGPADSKYSRLGVEISDSPLVVLTTGVLTRMGSIAIEHLKNGGEFVRGLHSMGNLKKEDRYICHFPEDRLLMSINTNYGGNAALSKKPHALRLESIEAKKDGWLAEHMFILEMESATGDKSYAIGALPSGSGKTNLAMIKPPSAFNGWKTRTLGDDLAWLHADEHGKLKVINPENGFFGVAYGTGLNSNPNIIDAIKKNTIFTNVGVTPDGKPWWEGLTKDVPEGVIDWKGQKWDPSSGQPVANKNSRYATPISQYGPKSEAYDDAAGVSPSIIIFGGRRAGLIPLVYEAYNWEHGILLGAMMRVETTAAQAGKVGEVRQDPMAMLAFCGYNMGEYFGHWVEFGKKLKEKPRVFFVNWFRKNEKGEYVWPGFSENFRIIKWMMDRVSGKVDAVATPIGYVPKAEDIDTTGLSVSKSDLEDLLSVDRGGWLEEIKTTKAFFEKFGDKMPKELWDEYYRLEERLKT